jgi:hypothetical protein
MKNIYIPTNVHAQSDLFTLPTVPNYKMKDAARCGTFIVNAVVVLFISAPLQLPRQSKKIGSTLPCGDTVGSKTSMIVHLAISVETGLRSILNNQGSTSTSLSHGLLPTTILSGYMDINGATGITPQVSYQHAN